MDTQGCVNFRITTKAILNSVFAKILLHSQPQDPELRERVMGLFKKYECSVDAEVQQRCVEYLTLCEKGPGMLDIMAEMPKFPERQSTLLRKAGDVEGDAAEASATKLRLQQQSSMALVPVVDLQTANGSAHPPILRPSAAPVQTDQLPLTEPPSSAYERALSNRKVHADGSQTGVAAVAVPSLMEDPVNSSLSSVQV